MCFAPFYSKVFQYLCKYMVRVGSTEKTSYYEDSVTEFSLQESVKLAYS